MSQLLLCTFQQRLQFYITTVLIVQEIIKKRQNAAGAQFDIQAETTTSRNVIATGGYSKFCGGI